MTSTIEPIQPSSSNSNKTLPSITSKSGYIFPSIYSFPPFFTKQLNPQTCSHQFKLWQDLILSYCKFHRLFKIELNPNTSNFELFYNASISRKLSIETIREIADLMVKSGTADYDPPRLPTSNQTLSNHLIIYFYPITHWSNLIYDYIVSNGLTNSIMTLYELTSDEVNVELRGLDEFVLRKALGLLVKQGKAKTFKGTVDGIGGESDGVKFF